LQVELLGSQKALGTQSQLKPQGPSAATMVVHVPKRQRRPSATLQT
jgi:hypothetical protein